MSYYIPNLHRHTYSNIFHVLSVIYFYSPGDARRTTFQKAVEVYRRSTCIEWVQVVRSVTPGHVRVFDNKKGCASNVGMMSQGANNISLTSNCNNVSNVTKDYTCIICHS